MLTCASCGRDNAVDARFCSGWGAELAPAAPRRGPQDGHGAVLRSDRLDGPAAYALLARAANLLRPHRLDLALELEAAWWSDAVDVHVGAQAADAAAPRAEAEGDRSGARGYEDLATVLERMGRTDDARAALEQALERWERKRCLPDAGRTREESTRSFGWSERESEPTKEGAMLDHVAIPVRDLEASRKFYEPLFEGLGAKMIMEWPGGVLFGTDDGWVALRESEEVIPLHIAFRTDRPGVHSFHETALAAGASDNGAPGVRAELHENYYAAYVLDPDGHNIEAVSHRPE